MSYSMTLSFNGDTEAFEFPVLPGEIEVSLAGNNKTYEISALGEINIIKNQKLTDISFESMFPASWFPGCSMEQSEAQVKLFPPAYYIDLIAKWRAEKQPVRLVLTGSTKNISGMLVSIESFSWSEVGGSPGDISYQISFKEYRSYAAKMVKVGKGSKSMPKLLANPKTPARPDTRVKPKTYTLVAGDNLWKVAKKFLGDGSKYKQIQTLNGIKDSELKRLPVGKVIKLP
ncbi:LysM peptidoglycan-binding domain-containing protein [Paenibacillus macerans]|uniref:LysM peptidoglycan-binding domain-containing protein n=1 Tax=Paenibacillus macerans TaxID=44252 RepID=UPI0020405BD1|nr:LysM peptidoglycan-binding domain-containing protein [Paenibacillus macerans]MCM3701423.1 LysM peptidoglycan-binding domain-containing protein [Paenibacillus macerans]